MKKLVLSAMVALLPFAFYPVQLKAAVETTPTSVHLASSSEVQTSENDALILRLNEINEMDKTHLNFSERKELRREVHSMRSELFQRNGGIYFSAGGIIIIILLLILFL